MDETDLTQELAQQLQGKSPDFRNAFWERMRAKQLPMAQQVADELEREGIHVRNAGLEEAYAEELSVIPQGAVHQISKLKKKYRALGLAKY